MYKLILIPERAVVPEDIDFEVVKDVDIVQKIAAGATKEVMIPVNSRELQMLVEYRDLLHIELRAVIGLSGAMYNTIWNTYVSTMKRVTVDNLRTETFEARNARSDAGQTEETSPAIRASHFRRLSDDSAPTVEDDSATGEIE